MIAPDFWNNDSLISRLLTPLGYIYGIGVTIRRVCTKENKVNCPVICVGNFVVGGAGKTPVALALADWFIINGYSPHFLTRGYGGQLVGPVQVKLEKHTVREVGDEALLLARKAPTWVSRNRSAGADEAILNGADLILMDDGFQNWSLYKDLSIIVIDDMFGVGNGRVMPAGPLREFLSHGISRADLIVLLSNNTNSSKSDFTFDVPTIKASLITRSSSPLKDGTRVIAFTGIGRPQKFFETLRSVGYKIIAQREFADHHIFLAEEINVLKALAKTHKASLITTEKDFVRLHPDYSGNISVLPVDVRWIDEKALGISLLGVVKNG